MTRSPGPERAGCATVVRELTATDRAAWQPLWEGYLGFYRAELDAATTEATFTRLCDESDRDFVGLLATREGEAVGLAHLVFHATTWSPRPRCYLEDLFVAPTSRGAGIAAALLEAVDEQARGRGAGDVYWHTQQFNAAARSLYDTFGRLTSFVVYERDLPPR